MQIKRMLPNPFMLENGKKVTSLDQWDMWREGTKNLVLELEYGSMPDAPEDVKIEEISSILPDEDGTPLIKNLKFTFIPKKHHPDLSFDMDVTIRFPPSEIVDEEKKRTRNFGKDWLPCVIYVGGNPCYELNERGYVVINYQNNQLEPMEMGNPIVGPAQTAYNILEPNKYSWGSISVWAWGGMRMVDYALKLPQINKDQLIITGHSRNGKTALLTGALDERIAIVCPAGSGCAGCGSLHWMKGVRILPPLRIIEGGILGCVKNLLIMDIKKNI